MRTLDRETYEVDIQAFELDECQRVISERPIEGLILRFTDDRSFDIGALCYQTRSTGTRSLVKKVDVSTLRTERVTAMRAWVVNKITLFYTGQSAYTISQNASELNGFFKWADSKELHNFLETPENYQEALQSYTQELHQKLDTQKSNFTANRLQSEALRSASVFFPNTKINFRDDLPLISNSAKTQKPTEPPLQEEIEAYLTPCQMLRKRRVRIDCILIPVVNATV